MGAQIFIGKNEFVLCNFHIKIGAMSYSDLSDIPLLNVSSEYNIGGRFAVGTSGSYGVHLP